jgi:23S rRNA (uracil1939-C5)-methyltransferase
MSAERQPQGLKLAGIDEVEVTIDKLVAGGDGFGRWEGVPLFVPRTAPGDRVRARIVERRPDFGRAEVVEVLEPGPGRREPPCPYFERCGGCDLQHIEDELQVELKAEAVLETLRRLGRIDTEALASPPEVIAAEPWAYRLRAQLHVDPEVEPAGVAGSNEEGAPGVGYFERGSHELVAIDRCPILVPELEEMLPLLPRRLAEANLERLPKRLDLTAGGELEGAAGEITTAPVVEGLPHGPVSTRVAGFHLSFDARSFFQSHRGLLDRLVEVVLGPEDWTGDRAFDLYCGVGLFALPLSRRYRHVVGVEGDRIAIRFARNNARKNGAENLQVEGMAVESWVDHMPENADRVVVDPPRAGCHPKVVEALLKKPPRRLTYVSCHPATLARDLRKLTEIYEIQRLSLIDLFPQSGHMEVVVQLERK